MMGRSASLQVTVVLSSINRRSKMAAATGCETSIRYVFSAGPVLTAGRLEAHGPRRTGGAGAPSPFALLRRGGQRCGADAASRSLWDTTVWVGSDDRRGE